MATHNNKVAVVLEVVDRVQWTAGATKWNKQLLSEAIAEAITLSDARSERLRCANVCREIGLAHQQVEGTYAAGKKAGAYECAERIEADAAAAGKVGNPV